MTFDTLMLGAVVAEVDRQVVGRRMDDVLQPAFDEVILVFGRRREAQRLVISSSPEFGRIHFTHGAEPSPPTPPPFCSALRRHLRSAVLRSARQVAFDRVLRLEFDHCQGYGAECRRTFVAEIMGRHANMALLDEGGTILSCAKHVTIKVNRYRETLPGIPYIPPPAGDRIDPLDPDSMEVAAKADAEPELDLEDWLRRRVMGMSPVLVEELLWRLSTSGASPSAQAAIAELRALIDESRTPGASAWLYWPSQRPSPAPPQLAYPVPLRHRTESVVEERPEGLSAALDELVRCQREGAELARMRERLLAEARRAHKRLQQTRSKCQASMAEAAEWETWKRQGELLMAHAGQLSDGIAEASLTDYFEPDQPLVTIELDPTVSIAENAQRLFERHKRGRRAVERLEKRLRSLDRKIARLNAAEGTAEFADRDGLDDIAAALRKRKLIAAERAPTTRRRPAERTPWRSTTSRDGLTILYGRNERENDAVLREAAPSDWWLHARNRAGGHVIVRCEAAPDKVPRSALVEAAALAASLISGGGSDAIEVDYAQRKYVTRRRGAGPGQVTYTDFKTILVAPPDSRSDREAC